MAEDPNEEDNDGERDPDIEKVLNQLHQEILERERGILTRTDREFLLGIKEYEYDQSSINKRRDIRNRICSGLLDLQLLSNISDADRKKIFSQTPEGDIHESMAVLIAFVYSGLDGNIRAIEQIVESGLFKAERGGIKGYRGGARDVSVDINLTLEYDVEQIYDRFKEGRGDDLTPAEIGVLVREGRLDSEDYKKLSWEEDERPRNTPAANREQWYWDNDTE